MNRIRTQSTVIIGKINIRELERQTILNMNGVHLLFITTPPTPLPHSPDHTSRKPRTNTNSRKYTIGNR